MATITDIIREDHAEILARWTEEARRSAAARGLDRPEFLNIFPTYLAALAEAGGELGRFSGRRRELVESHLSSRLRQGFQVAEIVDEFSLLGRCIAARWEARPAQNRPALAEVERLFSELHLASAAAADSFTRHMLEDEQAEKRYLRLIQSVARDALEASEPPLRERLKEVLQLIMEAMGAQAAAVLLYRLEDQQLMASASAGVADEQLEQYARELSPSSFLGQVASRKETTAVLDAATTELEVSESLRTSGIHSLLGVRLPTHYRLVGILYVGLTQTRAFSTREIRRLESLGERLTLHLDNARLFAEVRESVEALRAERERRERFVSMLAHDIRGPLSVAKMGAQMLMRFPEKLDARRDTAEKIDRNLERAEGMVRDILDVSRLEAGGRLPLRLERCELGALAQEVVEELTAQHGPRFVLDAQPHVTGFWSASELRRALWNLATNALKYGAAGKPITVRARANGESAEASVHNEVTGAGLSPEDQQRLFKPFARTASAQASGQEGWGLGLMLVKGCAEAHGGRVEVVSEAGAGTTFSLVLPFDSRPYQPADGEASDLRSASPPPALRAGG